MAKSTYDNIAPRAVRKRSAVTGTLVGVRLQKEEIKAIDSWAAKQKPPVTRPHAIRRLVERGLLADTTTSPDQRYQAKASESAGKAAKLAKELGLKAKK